MSHQILSAIGLVIYALYIPIFMTASLPPSWTLVTVIAVDVIVCVTFYGTFHFADRAFPDVRRREPHKNSLPH